MFPELDGDAERLLVARCVAGEDAAWGELYRRYAPRVHRLVALSARLDADREDLVQRVFVELLQSLSGYRGDSRLTSWLYRLTARLVVRDGQREHQRRHRESSWQLAWSVVRGDTGASPEAVLNARQELATLERALRELPVEQRVVWALREVDGLDVSEVAKALGCTQATVRVRHFRARRAVMDAVSGEQSAQDPEAEPDEKPSQVGAAAPSASMWIRRLPREERS